MLRSDRHNFSQILRRTIYYILTNFSIKKCDFYEEISKKLDEVIKPYFTSDELDELAREAGFVKRESKLNGSIFFDLIVFHSENLKSQSLNDLSISLKDKYDIDITKQSLHDRFNNNALLFLKIVLEHILQKQISTENEFLSPYFIYFNRILIKDSTSFQIDPSLSEYYPGSAGSASGAAVRIQFEYDLLTGRINDLSVNAFNDQDATNSIETMELTQEGDLIIRDLAYMSLEALQTIISTCAFFISRTSPSVNVYEMKNGEYIKMDFYSIAKHMRKNHLPIMEKEVYLGEKEKFKIRMIIYLIPEQEAEKRLRKAEQKRKKKGIGQLSKEYKSRALLNLFITNTDTVQIPSENIWKLYRLRWQIELIFKIWKSVCDIEKVKKVKKERLECYIFSKLIQIVLCWQIMWKTAVRLFYTDFQGLSFFKASKTLIKIKLNELREILILGKGDIEVFTDNFYKISRTNHTLEKKHGKETSLELLITCSIIPRVMSLA